MAYTTAGSLKVLSGLDPVRKRPGMYVGSTSSSGLTHCLWEVVDNSVDEALAGYAKNIYVHMHSDGSFSVLDDGRGIPVDTDPKTGMSGLELVFTKLHAGGKFDTENYKVSGGLHGVGASVTNALSRKLVAAVKIPRSVKYMVFEKGKRKVALKSMSQPTENIPAFLKTLKTGTFVRFWPDLDIFDEGAEVNPDQVFKRLETVAALVPGLKVQVVDENSERNEVFHYPKGIQDVVSATLSDTALSPLICLSADSAFSTKSLSLTSDKTETVQRSMHIDFAFAYSDSVSDFRSFVNIVPTPLGGTHVAGMEKALVKFFNQVMKDQRILKTGDPTILKEDIYEGLVAVLSVSIPEPQFEGQTKEILSTREATPGVYEGLLSALEKTFSARGAKASYKPLLEHVASNARERVAAKESRALSRTRNRLRSSSMPAKLVDCNFKTNKGRFPTEIYIVEGDSALGTFKQARDALFQAALPIRGKILNTYKASEKAMLANAECQAIAQVLGAGTGKGFQIENLRYDKVIILADADVDGSHIRSLLLTLFHQYMPGLIKSGKVYAAVPPLHKVELKSGPGKGVFYTYTDAELSEVLQMLEKKGAVVPPGAVQRYKGLGEMDATQLAETTLDPTHRKLRRLTAEIDPSSSFETCMGSDVARRKEFIVKGSQNIVSIDV